MYVEVGKLSLSLPSLDTALSLSSLISPNTDAISSCTEASMEEAATLVVDGWRQSMIPKKFYQLPLAIATTEVVFSPFSMG